VLLRGSPARRPGQVAAYLRSKSPTILLSTLLIQLTPLGLAGSGPIPDGAMLPADPIGAIASGNYLHFTWRTNSIQTPTPGPTRWSCLTLTTSSR
jgi:hypothetical protein